MSTVRLLSPSMNLTDAVADLVGTSPNLSDSIVVFPGKRPAHVLRKRLSERIGSAFLPPQIFSIDLFVDFLHSMKFKATLPAVNEFDAVAILFGLHTAMQGTVKIGGEHFATLETFYPVGVKIFSELEELTVAAVTPQKLRTSVSSVTLSSAAAFALLFEQFYDVLRQKGFSSRAIRYREVAENIGSIDLTGFDRIILAGFFAFTQTEETIIRHVLSLQNVTVIFQNGEGIQETLERLHLNPEPEGTESEQEIQYYESPDAHGQLFALNRVLEQTYPDPIVDSGEAVIVLPSSENLFPLYHQTLSAYGQSTYNLALGYPLSRTPVYGFLVSLLEVIASSREGKVYVPSYVQFLLHPYTKNILFSTRADITRMAIHAIEDYCLEHSARVFLGLDEIETDPHLHEAMMKRMTHDGIDIEADALRAHIREIHSVTLRSFLNVRTVAEFADACIAVLQYINERSTAHRHPYFRPFVETLLEQFVLLKQSLLSDRSFGKIEYYLLFLRHFAESGEVPFTGTPLQGLQVLGFLETRGLQFNTLFMIDANDDILPGRAQQDVFLPLQIREQLGLSTYRDQEKIKTYIFDVLRRGSRSVHYFYINSHQKEKSRFVARLQWYDQLRRNSLDSANIFSQHYAIDLGTENPGPIMKDDATVRLLKEFAFSSSALDTYRTCGLRFYYRYVLRLREKEEVSGDVEQTDIGLIVHDILREYFSPMKGRPLIADDLDEQKLKKAVSDNFRSMYGSEQFGEQFFTKRQVEKHLVQFVSTFQKNIVSRSAVVVEALEETLSAEIDGIRFTGKADRIETRNGTIHIIDFKTGHNETKYRIAFDRLSPADRKTWKDSIGSVQLPMYVMLYSESAGIQPGQIVPSLVFIGRKELDDEIEVNLFESEQQSAEWYPKLREIILSLTREILDVSVPFMPTEDFKNDCSGCPFTAMCGTLWVEKTAY
ncbi:MAG: PD-(D/E)XK nuclease family protein [Bacteroidota bacterium]